MSTTVTRNRSRNWPLKELLGLPRPLKAASQADIVITMLPDSADSEEVILGKDGVLEGARKGSVIVDMSSIAPLVSIKIAAEAEKNECGHAGRPGQRRRAEGRRRHPGHYGGGQ